MKLGLLLSGSVFSAPNVPTNVTATADANSILVDWDAPATGTTPVSYRIYRSLYYPPLITGNDSDFTSGVGNWVGTNATLNAAGGYLAVITPGSASIGSATSGTLNVRANWSYTFSVKLKTAAGTRPIQISIQWLNSSNGVISTKSDTAAVPPTGIYQTRTLVETAPATAAYAKLILANTTTGATFDQFHADDVKFSRTATVSLLATVTAPTTQYDDTTTTSGSPFAYTVTALAGGLESEASSSVNAAVPVATLDLAQARDGAVARWNLNEASGTSVADEGPNNLTGTHSGTVTPGATTLDVSQPYATDYGGGYTFFADHDALSPQAGSAGRIAVECIVSLDTMPSVITYIFNKAAASAYEWSLAIQADGSVFFAIWVQGGGLVNNLTQSAAGVITTGTRAHIVAQWDRVAQVAQIWVNKIKVVETTGLNSGNLGSDSGNYSAQPRIGIRGDNVGQALDGRAAMAAVYDYPLTQAQIEEHYALGLNVSASGSLSGSGTLSGVRTVDSLVIGELWENGVFVASLGTATVSALGNYEFTWDAALLSDRTGANAELRLVSPSGFDIDGIAWDAQHGVGAPAHSGSGSTSGSGTVTATGVPNPAQAGAVAGAGSLTATGVAGPQQTGALAGAGSLTATGVPTPTQAGTVAGAGSLTATGTPTPTAAGSLSGVGALTGQGTGPTSTWTSTAPWNSTDSWNVHTVAYSGTGNVAGTGSIAAVGAPGFPRPGTLAGAGSVTGTGTPALQAAGSVAGAGAVTAVGSPRPVNTGAVAGAGTITGTGTLVTVTQTGATSGAGTVTAVGVPRPATTANTAGAGAITATSQVTASGSGTLAGAGALTTVRLPAVSVAAAVAGAGTVTATGTPRPVAAGTLAGAGTVTGTSTVTASGAGALAGAGALTTVVLPAVSRPGALAGAGSVTAVGAFAPAAQGTLAGAGALTTARAITVSGTGTLAGVGTLTTAVLPAVSRPGTLVGTGTLTATGAFTFTVTGQLSGVGTLTTATALAVTRTGAVAGVGTVTGSGYRSSFATLPPDAILTQTGFTGTVGTIQDDPTSPDVNRLVGSGAVALRVSFGSPNGTLVPGAGIQTFRIRMRRSP